MALEKLQISFKIDPDALSIFVKEWNKRWLIHFRQECSSETAPQKHYLFAPACNISDILAVCLCVEDPNFKKATIITDKHQGATYLLELVKVETSDGKFYVKLQTRDDDNQYPYRWITITEFKQFKELLIKANTAYNKLFSCRIQRIDPARFLVNNEQVGVQYGSVK